VSATYLWREQWTKLDMINAERALDALGDPTRRLIFRRLREGNRSVREIADGLKVSRPAVSQHLSVLKDAGLAVVRIEGTRRLPGNKPIAVPEMAIQQV